MKNERAIEILLQQKGKLDDKELDEVHWVDETLNFLELIFGKSSPQYHQIFDLNISIDDNIYYGGDNNPLRNRERAKKYFDSFILQVPLREKLNQKEEVDNKLKITKSLFWSIMPVLISGTFYLGYLFGNNRFDNEKLELYEENKSLKYDITKLKKTIQIKIKENNRIKLE